MTRRVAAILLSLAWLVLSGLAQLEDLDYAAYGNQPIKAALMGLGQGTDQEDGGEATTTHKQSSQAWYLYPGLTEGALPTRARDETKDRKENFKLYKFFSVFLI